MTLENEPLVLVDSQSGITTLTLNRGDKYNALSEDLLDALKAALLAADQDPDCRVVILGGAGKAFCAGHDLKEMRADSSQDAMLELFNKCSDVMLTIAGISKPVIARIHGIATAAGCQLVAACDLAVAADHARFATSGINVGLFCSTPMVATSRNLPRKQALEMLLTGDFMDAGTAERFGLVNHVVPLEDLDGAVRDLAAKIVAKSPAAVAIGKRLFYRQLEASLAEAYGMAAENMACNMQYEDAREGIDAFINKRPPPDWKGR